jgi:hypothetical protein
MEANEGAESRSQTKRRFPGRGCPASNRQVLEGGEVMAVTTPEQRRKHIHGLAVAAKKIQAEERNRENENFKTVLKYFREKANQRPR